MAQVSGGGQPAGARSRALPTNDRQPHPGSGARGRAPGAAGGGRAKLGDVRRGSTLNLASSVVSAVTTTGLTLLATRAFHPAEAGAFFTSISAFAILVAVAALGTNIGLTYFVARLRSLGEEHKIPALIRSAVGPVIIASIAVTGIMFLISDPLAHLVLRGHADRSGVTPEAVATSLRAIGVAMPFAGVLNAYLGASRGYGDMRPTAYIGQMAVPAGRLLGAAAAAALGASALLAPLWAVSYVPAALVAWYWMRRISRTRARPRVTLPDVPPEVAALLALSTPVPPDRSLRLPAESPSPDRPGSRMARRRQSSVSGREFWKFTTPRAIANTAQNILQSLDVVLVAAIRGPQEAAIYTAATRFLVIGQLGSIAISRGSQARFTELFTVGDRRGANEVYQVTTSWLVVLMWPMFLLSVIFGPLVLAVFGRAYDAGGIVMVILGLSMLVATVCGQVDMVLITAGRSSWSLANGLLTVVVNVGIDVALIPKYGITGAAIGWAIAITVSNLVPLAQLSKVFRLHPFGRGTIIACVLSALSFGALALVIRFAVGDSVLGLAVALIGGCALYVPGLLRFRKVLHLPAMPRRLTRIFTRVLPHR
jgi:O-antigen/teichoic acid export membrane protein